MTELGDTITFLGTAGARFVVTRQFLASGGAWLTLGNTQILLDPGPGSLVQAAKRKLDPVPWSRLLKENLTLLNWTPLFCLTST